MRPLPLSNATHLFQGRERRVGSGGRAGRVVAAEAEVRARGGVLEAGEHPPVHDEEEGHQGAPPKQSARGAPPPAPPPRPQHGGGRGARRHCRQRRRRGLGHGRWIWISRAGFGGDRAAWEGARGVEWLDRCVLSLSCGCDSEVNLMMEIAMHVGAVQIGDGSD